MSSSRAIRRSPSRSISRPAPGTRSRPRCRRATQGIRRHDRRRRSLARAPGRRDRRHSRPLRLRQIDAPDAARGLDRAGSRNDPRGRRAVAALSGWESVAYVPQRFGLLPELTIRENIELPFRLRRETPPPSVARTIALLALERLSNRLPHETSVGQQQRAALARAVASTPRMLLADEPTSHQDRGSAARVWAALAEARAAGVVVLVATHDTAAVAHADRVWELANGRLAEEAVL